CTEAVNSSQSILDASKMAQASDGLRLRGQSELLTRRLKRLLDEYSDGLAVPKELLQNADDAGATEVTLLYDCRENSDWRGSESLLDPAMADCQGRA
uniref:Rhodanese domain-containing protein n=1 Tax=Macrostomum lignano TaxID=282301 RepID=A0A1I8J563_9PLAT